MACTGSEQIHSDADPIEVEIDEIEIMEPESAVKGYPLPFPLGNGQKSFRSPRVKDTLNVQVITKNGNRRMPATDISMTGIYVKGVTAPLGREVPLRIPLPGETSPLDVSARVVRCDNDPEGGLGLTFSRIGWEDLICLARYLAPRL